MKGKVDACVGRCKEKHQMGSRCRASESTSVDSKDNDCVNDVFRTVHAGPGLVD